MKLSWCVIAEVRRWGNTSFPQHEHVTHDQTRGFWNFPDQTEVGKFVRDAVDFVPLGLEFLFPFPLSHTRALSITSNFSGTKSETENWLWEVHLETISY